MEQSLRGTDGPMNGATDEQTDKGDDYGPHWVTQGLKLKKANEKSVRYRQIQNISPPRCKLHKI